MPHIMKDIWSKTRRWYLCYNSCINTGVIDTHKLVYATKSCESFEINVKC